jgi:D-alanyl-lipoteichoic acid acyltransferase DltB (MBOAT superfamily)
MIVSVIVNLAILFFFKYLIFFTNTAWSLARLIGYEPGPVELHIILPLGISFYIFATISYVIDVYRRAAPVERDPLVYFCFVTFFPHLVAGPILRAGVLIPQLSEKQPFQLDEMFLGVRRILYGLFLKVVLADNVAPLVNQAFAGDLGGRTGIDAWTMAFLFGFQIYFDFAAYSHIAIGSARLMGIVLPENFNFPYAASSPRDFWQRWHISLSTWVRDYLYVPLQGRREAGDAPPSEARRTRALFITWTLMGLWHGANWTFALWGVYHAACIWVHRKLQAFGGLWARLPPGSGWIVTLPAMMAAWIPFRAPSLHDALGLWLRMVDPRSLRGLTLTPNAYIVAALLLVLVTLTHLAGPVLNARTRDRAVLRLALDTTLYTGLITLVFMYLQVRDQFIYFQF